MGPVQVMLLGFEDFQPTIAIAGELASLSDAGTITVIDARFVMKGPDGSVVAARASDLTDTEREDLRAAAGALVGMSAGAVVGGEEGAAVGALMGAEAGLWMGETILTPAEFTALTDALLPGDALLLLVIEHTWAAGLLDALRVATPTVARHDYITAESLVDLGAMLGVATIADS